MSLRIQFIFFVLMSFVSSFSYAEFKYEESFNGFDVDSKLNTNNKADAAVSWTDEANTSIVRLNSVTSLKGLERVLLNKPKANFAEQSSDQKAALFKYAAGAGSWAEQRFLMKPEALNNRKGLTEVWLQYDIFIPDNFKLIDSTVNATNYLGGGHKVLTLYADKYSYPNSTIIFGQLFARKSPAGAVVRDDNAYNDSTLSTYVGETRVYTQFNDLNRSAKWVDSNFDLGRWQRRVVHFKFPTSSTSNDGVVEAWIKRANGKSYKIISKQGGSFYSATQNYFNAGYLNGYNNDGFAEATYLLVDNFIIAESKDVIDSSVFVSSNETPNTAFDCNVANAPANCKK